MASGFQWTPQRTKAAIALAEGQSQVGVARELGITDRTVRNWVHDPEFSAEVDRLTLMTGIASRAERLRIAQRVARQRVRDDVVETDRDILDWLKYAQGETDGLKLDLAALAEAFGE
jgi:transposase-like protein